MSWNYAGRWGADHITDSKGVPLPNTTVHVYLTGTTTPATLYTDRTKTTTVGSVATDANGNLSFFADPGMYDVTFNGTITITVEVEPDSEDIDNRLVAARRTPDYLNVKDYGAVGNGVNDDTAEIQSALSAAVRGQVVYVPVGKYSVSSPLLIPPGVHLAGSSWLRIADGSTVGNLGSCLVPQSSFSTSGSIPLAVVAVVDNTTGGYGSNINQGAEISDIFIDGSTLATSGVHGIAAFNDVRDFKMSRVTISQVTGHGIYSYNASNSASDRSPDALRGTDVFIRASGMNGVCLQNTYGDMAWFRVHTLGCGTTGTYDGWVINDGGGVFNQCRAEWSTGNGYAITSTANYYGSAPRSFIGCLTDRNYQNGMSITNLSNSNGPQKPPISLVDCMFTRDGRNGVDGTNSIKGYSGLLINSASSNANHVVVGSGISGWPNVDDNGSTIGSGTISSGGTTLTLGSPGLTVALSANDYIQVEAEIMQVTAAAAVGATSVTVTRAAISTTAVAHTAVEVYKNNNVASPYYGLTVLGSGSVNLSNCYFHGVGVPVSNDAGTNFTKIENSITALGQWDKPTIYVDNFRETNSLNRSTEVFTHSSSSKGATMPRLAVTSSTSALSSGVMSVMQVPLRQGETISSMVLYTSGTAGASITHGWYVLLDENLKVLGVTADQTAGGKWTSTATAYSLGFTSPFVTPYAGIYYVGVMLAGTTMPNFLGSPSLASGANQTILPAVTGQIGTGLTTPPTVGSSYSSIGGNQYPMYSILI